ncbi:hypothetical protein QQF64_023851 [Cirrhinus molitorella]|uniref:Prolactin receptor n=1 Tax=Cirrhinus molitorella TaxID=172907 RepID=A0ABR3NKG0_9TELE
MEPKPTLVPSPSVDLDSLPCARAHIGIRTKTHHSNITIKTKTRQGQKCLHSKDTEWGRETTPNRSPHLHQDKGENLQLIHYFTCENPVYQDSTIDPNKFHMKPDYIQAPTVEVTKGTNLQLTKDPQHQQDINPDRIYDLQ